MGTIAALLVGGLLLLVIGIALGKKKPQATTKYAGWQPNDIFYEEIMKTMPDKAQRVYRRLKDAYDNGETPLVNDIYAEIGVTYEEVKELFASNEVAGDIETGLALALMLRHGYQFSPLSSIDKAESFQKYQINLHDGEILHHRMVAVELYEEKTVGRNVNYSGYSWQTGIYRTGRLSYTSQVIKDFVLQDSGRLYFTNKRLIYAGKFKNQNRSIAYDKILNFKLYQDGVLLGTTSGKAPLLKFPEHDNVKAWKDPNDAINFTDGMNRFIRVLSRVMNGTVMLKIQTEEV